RPPPIPKLPTFRPAVPRGHGTLREAFALPLEKPPLEKPQPPSILEPPTLSAVDSSEVPAQSALIEDAPAIVSQIDAPGRTKDVVVYAQSEGKKAYRLPDLSLFDVPPSQVVDDSNRVHVLEDTLASFGVGAKVSHIERGPSITRYELRPERGVKISRIASLADDLALALAATSVRIEAPIPGKSAVGIEVPNQTISVVAIREILDALPNRGQVPPLWMALGKDITGHAVIGDLSTMPHLLVAGATGAGKSVCLNTIIASLLVTATPDQVQMLMIDPKRVELTVFNGIPHLIKEVISDPRLAAGALFEMTKEMESRYERFAKAGVRKIEEYNAKYPQERLPYVVIVIDELADLMLIAPAKVETTIMRLAQLARATGIHLVVATQRPSVDVITGLIKANVPSRIAFAVTSQTDSRVILDMNGAERLLGRGDMLYLPIDAPKPKRAQGAFISAAEVSRLVEFWARQSRPENLLDVEVVPLSDDDAARRDVDPLCYDAAKFIIESNYASTAALQSQFSIGHPRAVRVMKQLEEFKIVGQHEGTKPRKILIGIPELELVADRLGKGAGGQQDLFASGA
ncbi:MAG: DNA translocase FtsK, partial [Candidatus Eremiobacteraeota bacterium]|nr:DNA translocase FtsK [Candidatus Eremiobacteraeota bacterium]